MNDSHSDSLEAFAKLFETEFGQLLVTIEQDDENEGEAVKIRGAAVNGIDACAVLACWDNPDAARVVFDKFDQSRADEMAERLRTAVAPFGAAQ